MLFIFELREYPNKNNPTHKPMKLFMGWINLAQQLSPLAYEEEMSIYNSIT